MHTKILKEKFKKEKRFIWICPFCLRENILIKEPKYNQIVQCNNCTKQYEVE